MDINHTKIYIKVENNMYINIERNVVQVFIRFFRNSKPFEALNRQIRRELRWLPSLLIRALRVLLLTHQFTRKRKRFKREGIGSYLVGPSDGECIFFLRQGGVKVFNLKKQSVTTIFDEKSALPKVEKIISSSLDAARNELAPKVISWSIEGRSLEEELINLNRSSFNLNDSQILLNEIFPVLSGISKDSEYKVLQVSEYLKELKKCLDSLFQTWREYEVEQYGETLQSIEQFCTLNLAKFSDNPGLKRVVLVKSHGDFWEGNILYDDK